jgi:predicted double-glycine peptidase
VSFTLTRVALVVGGAALFAALGWRLARRRADAGPQAGSTPLATLVAFLGLLGILFHYADPRFKLDRMLSLPSGLWRDLIYAPGALLIGVALAHLPPRASQGSAPEPNEEPAPGAERARSLRQGILFLVFGYAVFLLHDPLFVLATASGNLGPSKLDSLDEVVMQRNSRNCVAASAASVLRQWGAQDLTDGEVALRAQTSYYGTSEHRIVDAVAAITTQLQAWRVKTTWAELRAMDHPCLLGVTLVGDISHAVALMGLDREHVYLGEPLIGLERIPIAFLSSMKPWDGWAIMIGRDFVHYVGEGERSPVLPRVRATLREIGELQGPLVSDPDLLDSALAERIAKVQVSRGLPPTGAIDPPTLLCLDALAGKSPSLAREAQRLTRLLASKSGS